ncbi:helix-turn-helix domain-containing protein [Kutzneria sp. NPDC051319]|uniref:helix-turn-helix domain-containing protein n=1 Tax=Kutzneria sp. NPDC051319 TaxID=3155047 RepID=UPI00341BEE5B
MSTPSGAVPNSRPVFYTVQEAAQVLRVNAATIYRAIQDDAFPAVRLRTRYVVPARAVDELAEQAAQSGGVVDIAEMAAERRTVREIERLTGGTSR